MATKPKSGVYKCQACGMVTTEKGHLCNPQEISSERIPVNTAASL
jgi:hypothetical protein